MWQLAVAASGGADSTALILAAASRFPPEQVIILSVDHGTRASASVERAHAQSVAERFGLAFRELTVGLVPANQAAWRQARFDVLVRFCEKQGIRRLWLGHHRDDAVETAALRLMANGELPSLAGISAVRQERGISIERPLLCRSARQLRRELMAERLAWYEDPSNRDGRYRRVAIRRLLAAAPGGPAARLVQETAAWREQHEALLARAWPLAVRWGPMNSLFLAPAVLHRLPGPVARKIFRQAALAAAGREQRIRNIDPGVVFQRPDFPLPLGGAKAWAFRDDWVVGRDYRHIQDQKVLLAGVPVCWDARYRLLLKNSLGGGGWLAARLGLRQARLLHLDLPADWAAATLAIWHGADLVAAPEFGVWRGDSGQLLQEALVWCRLPRANSGVFRLALGMEDPILRLS